MLSLRSGRGGKQLTLERSGVLDPPGCSLGQSQRSATLSHRIRSDGIVSWWPGRR